MDCMEESWFRLSVPFRFRKVFPETGPSVKGLLRSWVIPVSAWRRTGRIRQIARSCLPHVTARSSSQPVARKPAPQDTLLLKANAHIIPFS